MAATRSADSQLRVPALPALSPPSNSLSPDKLHAGMRLVKVPFECLYLVLPTHGSLIFTVIARILPVSVSVMEARADSLHNVLFPEEELALGQAVEKRRSEFNTGRECARKALVGLGLPAQPIPSGARGEPLWPAGIVGSITHCEGYRACAVAHAREFIALGIDAEPHGPLPAGVLSEIARAEELSRLRELSLAAPGIHWDRLLFSAKESIYKAWFPLVGRSLEFDDAEVCIDSLRETFSARLLVLTPSLPDGPPPTLSGRWLVRDGLVLTAIVIGAQTPISINENPKTLAGQPNRKVSPRLG